LIESTLFLFRPWDRLRLREPPSIPYLYIWGFGTGKSSPAKSLSRFKSKSFSMNKRRQVYEGKAKILYEGPESGTLIQYFKDDATAFNNQKHDTLEGKGVLNNRFTEYFMNRIALIGIPTHFIRRLNMREQLVKKVEIIPVEVIVRNIVAGSMAKRLGIEEGSPLPRSIVEFTYKKDELGDPLVSDEHVTALGWATPAELDDMVAMTLRINDFLIGLFAGIGIKLVDFKLEFGRYVEDGVMRIILADEISPDNCRLWDIDTNEKLDKDRFRRDLGGVMEAYQEVAKRLGILQETPEPTDHKGPVLVSDN
jgi:phosphoribosylaminoimidazole-succinocarboxamide synthase